MEAARLAAATAEAAAAAAAAAAPAAASAAKGVYAWDVAPPSALPAAATTV